MVDRQIAARGVRDPRVLDAMRATPRHRFVPERAREFAYDDRPLEIGHSQTISQPYIVAFMTELLEPGPDDHVLEIGTGSGYQTAVLAHLVKRVTTIERVAPLAEAARNRLADLGYCNVAVHAGDGTRGRPEDAPYDGILVTAAGPRVPDSLRAQLADGGRLVCPVGPRETQRLVKVTRHGDRFDELASIGCVFVPLLGEEGWHA
ncbi:MAG: protein-L-isoaspartate(D-aspartate) O-methyltransferase [Candidatus Hydrogenedentes bacterium]|nr:protein-L-isoaspartate(D-aspartate) O-methyltransferase [Candidatus Hydrogenedentota bacterium]